MWTRHVGCDMCCIGYAVQYRVILALKVKEIEADGSKLRTPLNVRGRKLFEILLRDFKHTNSAWAPGDRLNGAHK